MSAEDVAAEAAASQAIFTEARTAATYALSICGASVSFLTDTVNGVYDATGESSGDMPFYKKRGAEQCLEFNLGDGRYSLHHWILLKEHGTQG